MRVRNQFSGLIDERFSESYPFGFVSNEGETIIFMHGIIGDDWEGMDSRTIVGAIREVPSNETIRLDINTPGGFVFDAVSIYTALVQHDGAVIADITGAAESSGTIVASAADTIRISAAGFYTVHEAWTLALGNHREMTSMANRLRNVDRQIAGILQTRSGLTQTEIADFMQGDGPDGTTFTGAEAVEKGFADELIPLKGPPVERNSARKAPVGLKRRALAAQMALRRRAA